MDEATEAQAGEQRPRWRQIIDFPPVAMVIAIVLVLLAVGMAYKLGRLLPPIGPDARTEWEVVFSIALATLVYKLVIVRLGDHPRDDLPARGAIRNLALGLVGGFVIFSVIVAAAATAGVYRIVGPGDASSLLIELVATSLKPGFIEELLFRGILFRWLEELGGTWAGLVLSSLAFGFAHYFNPNSSVMACLWIALEAGVLFGGAYMLSRSLWMPMGLHAAWNFTQGEIFDVPVSGIDEHGLVQAQLSGPTLLSGDAFGLEASVIALVIAALAGIWMIWLATRRGYIRAPMWAKDPPASLPVS